MSSNTPISSDPDRLRQQFESVLCQARFDGLKPILERVADDREGLLAAILGTDNYGQLLARLGHKLVLTPQIHVQDCYTRVGRNGTIKAVLPYHDIPTQSSLPTLVNVDGSVTTTPKAAAFFGGQLRELKKQLQPQAPPSH